MKIKLEQGTWLEFSGEMHNPADVVEVSDTLAMSLIKTGSAVNLENKEVITDVNVDKASSNSSED